MVRTAHMISKPGDLWGTQVHDMQSRVPKNSDLKASTPVVAGLPGGAAAGQVHNFEFEICALRHAQIGHPYVAICPGHVWCISKVP